MVPYPNTDRLFTFLFGIVFGVLPAWAAPRNVVLLIADDQGLQAGCYGDPTIKTPSIDRLASEGTRFAQAFATVSSCSASRSVLFTGQFNHTNGQYGLAHAEHNFRCRPGVESLPNLLSKAGYRTAIVGKHHVNPPEAFAFGETLRPTAEQGGIDGLAGAASRFIRTASEKPFFLVVGYRWPHRAKVGFGYSDKTRYKPETIPVPPWLPDLPETRAEISDYYEAISRLDQSVGFILDAIKEAGREKDTLVIYVSDNGPPWPGAKTTLYEPGIHMPLIVRSPEQKRSGVVSRAMVSLADIAPTILEWAGAAQPKEVFGKSFLPSLAEENPTGWDRVYGSHTFHEVTMYYPMRMIRTRQYKYILNIANCLEYPLASDLWGSMTWQAVLKSGATRYGLRSIADLLHRPKEELYDLTKDPNETRNLAADAAMAEVLAGFRKELKEWQEATRDPWLIKYTHE